MEVLFNVEEKNKELKKWEIGSDFLRLSERSLLEWEWLFGCSRLFLKEYFSFLNVIVV